MQRPVSLNGYTRGVWEGAFRTWSQLLSLLQLLALEEYQHPPACRSGMEAPAWHLVIALETKDPEPLSSHPIR